MKTVGPSSEQVKILLDALEKETGATFKDRGLATGIVMTTMALQEMTARSEEIDSASHVIVNGDVVNGYKFFGPFQSEDEAFAYAEHQFHLTKRWSVVELQKPFDR